MKKILIGMMIAGGLVSAAQAQNWIATPTPTTSANPSWIDVNSLVFTDHSRTIRSAWIRTYAPEINGTEYSRIFAHCATRMIMFGTTKLYSQQGTVISSTDQHSQWSFTVPGSLGEHWANIICSTSIKNRQY